MRVRRSAIYMIQIIVGATVGCAIMVGAGLFGDRAAWFAAAAVITSTAAVALIEQRRRRGRGRSDHSRH